MPQDLGRPLRCGATWPAAAREPVQHNQLRQGLGTGRFILGLGSVIGGGGRDF